MSVNEIKLSRSDSGLMAVIATPAKRLWLLGALALTTIVIFMTIKLGSNLQYILLHRGLTLATMLLVAFAASTSTLLFQTVTNNRILKPSIMGFENLFVLIQTLIIFVFGAKGGFVE